MAFDLGRFTQGAGSGAATAGGLSGFNPYITAAGAIVGGVSSLFGKSDKEIREEQIREYLKRRAELRDKSLQRLSEETGKNIGRINQFTTGSIKRGQGDIAAVRASKGKGFDEADQLALQGQVTGQGSEAIQATQDAEERARRAIEEQYQQDVFAAESEGIFAPQDPSFTDVLGSLAPTALQYGFNQQYLKNMGTTTPTGTDYKFDASKYQNVDFGNTNIGFYPQGTNFTGDKITAEEPKNNYINFRNEPTDNYFNLRRKFFQRN